MKTEAELELEKRELNHRINRLEYNVALLLNVLEKMYNEDPDRDYVVGDWGANRHPVIVGSIFEISRFDISRGPDWKTDVEPKARSLEGPVEIFKETKDRIVAERTQWFARTGMEATVLYVGEKENAAIHNGVMFVNNINKGPGRWEFMGMEVIPVSMESYLGFGKKNYLSSAEKNEPLVAGAVIN